MLINLDAFELDTVRQALKLLINEAKEAEWGPREEYINRLYKKVNNAYEDS